MYGIYGEKWEKHSFFLHEDHNLGLLQVLGGGFLHWLVVVDGVELLVVTDVAGVMAPLCERAQMLDGRHGDIGLLVAIKGGQSDLVAKGDLA